MIYWKKIYIIYIPKPNENVKYERYILFSIVLPTEFFHLQIMCLNFFFSKNGHLKCYSITIFKYIFFELNLHILKYKYNCVNY